MDDELVQIRDALRDAFDRNGFGGMLDRRYKISTAHMTAMRFSDLGGDWKRLASMLEENRGTDFGETDVNSLQLVWGDWYASGSIVRTLQEFRLGERCSME